MGLNKRKIGSLLFLSPFGQLLVPVVGQDATQDTRGASHSRRRHLPAAENALSTLRASRDRL